ncbi:U3 small nucleolar RNA-associated protein, partial [Thraustotheca clavata]
APKEAEDITFEAAPAVEEENPWLNSTTSKKRKKKQNKKKKGDNAAIGSAIEALATTTPAPVALGPSDKDLKRKADTSDNTTAKKQKSDKSESKEEPKKKAAELAQDELVRRAFAFADDGDEIQKEKDELAAQDGEAKSGAEVAKLTGMSGWGSWAGEGVKQSQRQLQRLELAKKVAADAKTAALAKRKDAKMARVLINEKKDKKAAKFMCATVPYPFTSREQYEMAMRNPLGSDWNTTKSTNALTVPAVMLRAGKIIQPLQLTKEQKNQATEQPQKKSIAAARAAKRKAKF